MGVRKTNTDRWRVIARIRKNGEILHKQQTIDGTKEQAKALCEQFKAELRSGAQAEATTVPAGSLTAPGTIRTFGEALTLYLDHHPEGRSASYFDRLQADLGSVAIEDLQSKFDAYVQILQRSKVKRTGTPLTNAAVNQYIARASAALSFCMKPPYRAIKYNPLAGYPKLPETERDRVLTDAERERLLNTLQKKKSHLYWAVYFSLKNPIRRGDLFNLKRENLDRFKPWIHFYPSKTRKRKRRETCLIFLDKALLSYFDSLPADCPYLFPRIAVNQKKKTVKWFPMGENKNHWAEVLKEENANIPDFHFHDLKHCAITWMLDNGYTDRDLKNLGVQYSQKMIDRYYKHDAAKVLQKWKKANNPAKCDSGVIASGAETGETDSKKAVFGNS